MPTVKIRTGTDPFQARWMGTIPGEVHFAVSVPQAERDRYGLGYPVTYEFQIPGSAAGAGLTVEKRIGGGAWAALPTRTAQASYTAQEGVRWDYAGFRAYVSAALDHTTSAPGFDLRFRSNGAAYNSATYVRVPKYFDNRAYAVCVTWDDWTNEFHGHFLSAVNACQARGLWCSPGIVPNGVAMWSQTPLTAGQWADIQAEIDAGFVDVAGHSLNHLRAETEIPDEATAIQEVDGCASAIRANLTLPAFNRAGALEVVGGWIEPFGQATALTRARMAPAGFIASRNVDDSGQLVEYAAYDAALATFARHGNITGTDNSNVSAQNARFDTFRTGGGIHTVYGHPALDGGPLSGWAGNYNYDWGNPNAPIYTHLDYISGHDDAWYVGLGHLYMYRLVALNATVSATRSA